MIEGEEAQIAKVKTQQLEVNNQAEVITTPRYAPLMRTTTQKLFIQGKLARFSVTDHAT